MNVRATPASLDGFAYTLSLDGHPIGWFRAGAMGFGPFPSIAAARAAADRALPELHRWYGARWCCAPLSWIDDVEPGLALRHGPQLLGRIVEPADVVSHAGDGCSIELRIPDVLWVSTAEDLARRLTGAMRWPTTAARPLRAGESERLPSPELVHASPADSRATMDQ